MTMFPAHHRQNPSKQNRYGVGGGGYGGGCGGGGYLDGSGYEDCFISLGGGGESEDLMADDESRTETSTNNEEDAGSSSKDIIIHQEMNKDSDDQGWLQLSLGGGAASTSSHHHKPHDDDHVLLGPRLLELDLLPGGIASSSGGGGHGGAGGGTWSQQLMMRPLSLTPPQRQLVFQAPGPLPSTTAAPPSFFLQQPPRAMTFTHHLQQETSNYLPFGPPFPPSMSMTAAAAASRPLLSSSTSSSFSGSLDQLPGSGTGLGLGPFYTRPPYVHGGLDLPGPPPSLDFRVVGPPRRPHSGVWFILQASQNQAKEPFLPQIPKSYLRIKGGRMTVRLLIKYLVNKLKLDSESEIEIRCKGQQLLPSLTLQHVRDNVWNSPRNDVAFTLLPNSSATTDHLMVLHYGRAGLNSLN